MNNKINLELLKDRELAFKLRFLENRELADCVYEQRVYDNFYKIKEVFEIYFSENGKYPTVQEFGKISREQKLFSNKYIDRTYGGMKNVRLLLGMELTDMRTGAVRGGQCVIINDRGIKKELEIYKILCAKFGKEFVHREYPPMDDSRVRVDFYVHAKGESFFVDVFYPINMHSMGGCMNNKIKKYVGDTMNQFPVIFLMTNDEIPKQLIANYLKNKKNPLEENQRFMLLKEFNEYIKDIKAHELK